MSKSLAKRPGDVIQFLRQRDYSFVRVLGSGASGVTVLLLDEEIDLHVVSKKYVPYDEFRREEYYRHFVREVQLMHAVNHPNVVRVYNHYLYPTVFGGYILMEFVDGVPIDQYLHAHAEKVNDIFTQVVSGFRHLAEAQILHRDIRPQNILVTPAGVVKIIDLGFGKRVDSSSDYDHSISNMRLWCPEPLEYRSATYDFSTDVYFVGKLFEKAVAEAKATAFEYVDIVRVMCELDPQARVKSFAEAARLMQETRRVEVAFTPAETDAYRRFCDGLESVIRKIDRDAKYQTDVSVIIEKLWTVYRTVQLELMVANPTPLINCFIEGAYFRKTPSVMSVRVLRAFVEMMDVASEQQAKLILLNLHTRLDAIPRYDDLPF